MFLRNSLSSVCVFFLTFCSITTFATESFQQSWSGLDDEQYIESLVNCEMTIKELQWSYNIWPKENRTEKPLFASIVSREQIYNSVIHNLKKQTVLANNFGLELNNEMLQDELDRMSRDTKDPKRLNELYASLDHNPISIAECVARPNLVNRLLQDQYKNSQIIHGDLNRRAQFELQQYQQSNIIDNLGAKTHTISYVNKEVANSISTPSIETDHSTVVLDQQSFDEKLNTLNDLAARSSVLQELDAAFVYEEVLEESPSSIKVKTLVWQKDSLNNWLVKQDSSFQTSPVAQSGNDFLLAEIGTSNIEAVSTSAPDSQDGPPDSWKNFSTVPGIRTAHTAVWTGTEMIVWGGIGAYSGLLLNTGARYNPATGVWVATNLSAAPVARHTHTAVWSGSEMIIWGGSEGNENVYNTGGRYNPLTDSWAATSLTDAPSARRSHTTVWTGTEMIVWGGNADGTQTVFLNTGGRYNPSTNSWTPTSTINAPTERWLHTAVWTGTEMIVWGGGKGGVNFLDTGGHYNPSTDTWTATGAWAPTEEVPDSQGRINHSAVWTGTEMIIWGGSAGLSNITITISGGRYNPDTGNWTETSFVNVPTTRIVWSTVWTGTEMIIWGGVNPQCCNYNTGARYNPASDTWTTTSVTRAPSPRNSHTAVWAGDEMIVFGGAAGTTEYRSGGRYNPVNDSWKSTPLGNVKTLSPRTLHSAVWSGSEMIVWGGFDAIEGYVNSGARYDPVTDYWVAMSLVNAPDSRAKHSANWTGIEMLIWGGSVSGKLNTGGIYDPAFDTWSTITTVNAPTARESHSSIWSGTEMIVWGGNDGSPVNTGARYDPDLDNWSTITTTDAPSARDLHSAIWTDTEMIVWGGSDNDTGGRYDPGSDTWTATAILDAPAARDSHSAIWTGTEMVIWGGRDDTAATLDSGARYDPDTDIWTEVTLTDAPTSRFLHSAVWTGTDMLIWGGLDASSTNTGSRYNPDSDTWTAMATKDVPNARQQHTAVWTGVDMVVWGGAIGSSMLSSGGRYDPDTNKWRAVTETNTLNYRNLYALVWTGENLIVWGGRTKYSIYTNLGGSYDKATDTWSPIQTLNAPAGRYQHTAIWTGSVMIIWGGSTPGSPYVFHDTGGAYNPVTDSWTDTQTESAPTGRSGNTAVWTGTEMIIWGGNKTDNASYNPLSNTWTPIADAPTNLSGHTVQWTGTEMLVWGGGEPFVGATTKGNRYTPSTNSWTSMSTTGAPTARSNFESVWTGSEMIIWGGYDTDSLTTGGRYNPTTDSWNPTSAPPITKRWLHSAIWTGLEMIVWGGNQEGSLYPLDGARYDPGTDTWKTMARTNSPSGINSHKAVWTGSEMIVWGGHTSNYLTTIGIYYPLLEEPPDVISAGPGFSFDDPDEIP